MILNYAVARYDLGAAKIVVWGSKIDHTGLLLASDYFPNRVALGMSFARKHHFIQATYQMIICSYCVAYAFSNVTERAVFYQVGEIWQRHIQSPIAIRRVKEAAKFPNGRLTILKGNVA